MTPDALRARIATLEAMNAELSSTREAIEEFSHMKTDKITALQADVESLWRQIDDRDQMILLRAERDALQQVLVDVTAHLVAAHSLLKRGGKKAAGSDKMFTIMLKDYEASIERGRNVVRAALKEGE